MNYWFAIGLFAITGGYIIRNNQKQEQAQKQEQEQRQLIQRKIIQIIQKQRQLIQEQHPKNQVIQCNHDDDVFEYIII